MTAPHWRKRDLEAQEPCWAPVEIDDRTVGGLVTLGRSVVFYSHDPRLRSFDGCRFANATAARSAIADALRRPASTGQLVWLQQPKRDIDGDREDPTGPPFVS